MTWPHGDPSVVVRAVLAQPDYRARVAAHTPVGTSLWGLVWNWLSEHVIAPLFAPIARAIGASHAAGSALGFVLVGLALLGLAFVAFRLAARLVESQTTRARRARAERVALSAARSSADWRSAARLAAERADYARAIAALFAAALAVLDEAAVVAFDAARTPSEYGRLVRAARASAAPPFDDLTEHFARAVYARTPPARAEYDAAQRAYAAFEPAVVA